MTKKPNVLLVTADQWPGSLIGAMGHPVVRTPTLDRLARDGVIFRNAYSETPVCIPARRALMTGVPARVHGDRVFKTDERMPALATLADTFRRAGYQAYAAGKMHVYPQRDRIGFDDILLAEEGRSPLGSLDDYEWYLGEQGHPGRQFAHGMSPNEYHCRTWHLAEEHHPTTWVTREMARTIRRRDPTRPALWYLSYQHPHPPLTPLATYLESYRDSEPPLPYCGDWTEPSALPYPLRFARSRYDPYREEDIAEIRRHVYALCTHIDHQLRVIIGTLREEEVLDNTIIVFTADHGDSLGNHGLWAKRTFYEDSARIPLIALGPSDNPRLGLEQTNDSIVGLQDIMPTLLDAAGIPAPSHVKGRSVLQGAVRSHLYGEFGEGVQATRMIRTAKYKLVYYAAGDVSHLFDLDNDPQELQNLAAAEDYDEVHADLRRQLEEELYGSDLSWLQDGALAGLPDPGGPSVPGQNRGLSGVRGYHWPPPPPAADPGRPVGALFEIGGKHPHED